MDLVIKTARYIYQTYGSQDWQYQAEYNGALIAFLINEKPVVVADMIMYYLKHHMRG